MKDYLLILVTSPDEKKSREIALHLVENKLAACVTIVPRCRSIYRWEEKISLEEEYLLLIKTSEKLYSKIEGEILNIHPYQVPEIIAFSINKGFDKYLAWIEKETEA